MTCVYHLDLFPVSRWCSGVAELQHVGRADPAVPLVADVEVAVQRDLVVEAAVAAPHELAVVAVVVQEVPPPPLPPLHWEGALGRGPGGRHCPGRRPA